MERREEQLNTLKSLPDSDVLDEAVLRIQRLLKKQVGDRLKFGHFRFVFHNGRFQNVEACPRLRIIESKQRFKVEPSERHLPIFQPEPAPA